MLSFKALLSLAAVLVGASAAPIKFADDVVKFVDVPAYSGRWYQMYANQIVYSTFEKDAVCVTADYSIREDGNIGVFNAQRVKTVDGELKTINGVATVPNPAEPGKLTVNLEGAPVEGSYWILGLGPVIEGKYQYSIVGDFAYPLGSLFVLGRDPEGFAAYDAEVKARLNELGYNKFFNKPIATLQKGCTYAPVNGGSSLALASSTVKQLDVNAYAGRWYQTHANQVVYSTFEKDAVCVTADYSVNPDGTVGVYNTQRVKTPSGEFKSISGTAYVPNPAEPGQLIVDLEGAPVQGTYWVMQLGPIVNGKYEYSIVADQLNPLGTLFVLSRKPSLGSYEPEVMAKLNEIGFNKAFNKPIATLQNGCTYPSTASLPVASFADPTVKAIDVPKYMGRWYNVKAAPITMRLFQKDCTCVTATYDLKADGTVGVLNRCRKVTPTGDLSMITGYAYIPDAASPGKLVVSLDGTPFPAPYWIVSLGPVENDLYSYAIVTDSVVPAGNMWVLVRDVSAIPRFEKEINARLTELGFKLDTLVPIVQEGCAYY